MHECAPPQLSRPLIGGGGGGGEGMHIHIVWFCLAKIFLNKPYKQQITKLAGQIRNLV